MRTTILAYVIALVGLAMIAVGAWGLLVFEAEETVLLGDYLIAIGTISGADGRPAQLRQASKLSILLGHTERPGISGAFVTSVEGELNSPCRPCHRQEASPEHRPASSALQRPWLPW